MNANERDVLILRLLEEVTPMVRNFAARSGLEFEDLRQDASLTILSVLDRVASMVNPVPFVVYCVKCRTIDRIEYLQRRRMISLDAPIAGQDESNLADLLPSPYAVDPLSILLAQERLESLYERFATRPARPMSKSEQRVCQEWHATAVAGVSYASM